MKIKVEIPKIRCERTTKWEWGKDEIYYAILVFAGRTGDNNEFIPSVKTPVFSKVSEVRNGVRKNSPAWRPEVNDHIIEVDDDTTTISVRLGLYERDSGDSHERLSQQFDDLIKPEGINWRAVLTESKKLILEDVNEDGELDLRDLISISTKIPELTNPMIAAGFLINVGKIIIQGIRQDDLIDERINQYNLNKTDCGLEHNFSGRGAKYDVQIKISKV